MKTIEMVCRCGYQFNSTEPHPCHNNGYQCRKPAQQRFYNPEIVGLAGCQMKLQMIDTWACDECWEDFKKKLDNQNNS